jgi:diacylglycerol kinase (ATP)
LQTKNILFVINPVSGGKTLNQADLISTIVANLPSHYTYHVKIWESLDQNDEIRRMISDDGYDTVVACGGDGTINFVAKEAIKKNITMGIVPLGSGNGLARHLGIPLQMKEAIKNLSSGQEMVIDTGLINGHVFLCTTGAGFDALIGEMFSHSKKRGFFTYAKMTLTQLLTYKPKEYTLSFNGSTIKRKAFIIAFANVNQYGNDTFIAPQADIQDGYLDVCIIKPFKAHHFPMLGLRIFNRTIFKSPFYEYYKTKRIELTFDGDVPVHYDGEPVRLGNKLTIEANPASLRMIVPARKQ